MMESVEVEVGMENWIRAGTVEVDMLFVGVVVLEGGQLNFLRACWCFWWENSVLSLLTFIVCKSPRPLVRSWHPCANLQYPT